MSDTTPMYRLSKSKLIAFRQCAKRLWLEVHRPELRDDRDAEVGFQIGNQVGAAARRIFDPDNCGVLIDINSVDWKTAFAESARLLADGDVPVFEAALQTEGALALADVMLPDLDSGKRRWRMIEVKSSTSVKDYHRDDIAIQAYIAECNGIPLSRIELAHINNQFVYPGNHDYNGLLHVEDLTDESRARTEEVKRWIETAQVTAALDTEPQIDMGSHCYDPFTCGFCAYCSRDQVAPEYSPTLLYRIRKSKLQQWESQGIRELCDVPDDEINTIQSRIKAATLSQQSYFDAIGAAKEMAGHRLPAYFLDFETVSFAVPIWKGTRPYEQLPFQYSLHKVTPNSNLSHTEFLDLSGKDPREQLAHRLIQDCGDDGPIYVYNASFEIARIRELADTFPSLAKDLHSLLPRIVDLLPIARNHYYHPSQRGSWSLKAIIPAICPELNYNELEGVQHGLAAVEAFKEAIAPETSHERKAIIQQQLLKYCALDTLATVKIWEFFRTDNS